MSRFIPSHVAITFLLAACGASTPYVVTPQTTWSAPTLNPPVPVAGPVSSRPAPFLWRIDTRGGTSYLLGTVHQGVHLTDALPFANQLIAEARVVAIESDPAGALQLFSAARLPDGESLESLLGPELWPRVRDRLRGAIPTMALKRLEPWFVAMLLQQAQAASVGAGQQELRSDAAMDMEVLSRATQTERSIRFLETVREAAPALNADGRNAAIDSIRQALAGQGESTESDRDGEGLARLIRIYSSGDERALVRELFSELNARPDYYERMFFRRNRAWMPAIERELQDGGAFIAVGAGHLVGPNSVIAMLREKGYWVTRVGDPAPQR